MKDTILLVGHGSRFAEGNREIERFAEGWREQHPGWHIELCFIEFAEVLLEAGLDRAAAQAAQHGGRVIVAPLILNAAGHVKMEIPECIDRARARHPGIDFVYARHLGADEAILAVLERSLRRQMAALDMPDPKTTGVVLLGRGSSDRVANGELAKMARWLYEQSDHRRVDIAFTGISWPRLEEVVQQQVTLGMRQIVILPYYLFTGTLIERIHRQVARLRTQYPQIAIECGSHFGFEPEIRALLTRRVLQAAGEAGTAMMECDGCHYRKAAAESAHHHHHHHSHEQAPAEVTA